jgi:hypothetical protein
MMQIVPKIGSSAIVEAEGEVPDLASAMAELQRAIGGMGADDVSVEFTSEKAGDRARTFFKFRAYRHRST